MIRELRLLDLGVIADATIVLGEGLTVITGETGAGKTMLLTGLGLLLGGRADPAAVRPGAAQAAVEGRLVPEGEALRIAEDAGAMLDDGELLVVRTVAAEGRSRAHLGGRSVPIGVLSQLGAEMVTVHGQSDQIRLRSTVEQRAALDEFAGPAQREALAALAQAHERRKALGAELERWEADEADRAEELARLEAALERIDALEPVAGELERLREEADRLTNVEVLLEAAAGARAALDGDELGAPGAAQALQAARHALEQAAGHDPQLREWSDRLGDAVHAVNDVVTETATYASSLEADPGRLDAVHERRAALTELLRTLAPRLEATDDGEDALAPLLAFASRARERVAELTAPGSGREGLLERLAGAENAEREAAAVVSENRRAAAGGLSDQVDAELEGLSMRGAHLHVELTPRAIGPTGAEDVELQLQPHPDAPPRPISKGASGGELSRIMLALEVALAGARARDERLPVFVFDEVDAGVGGRAATEVGRRLAELARHTQVVVVTHLAQVAAFAQTHLVVAKTDADARCGVVTTVRAVVEEERERELARMLSGEESATARQHAAELLDRPARADVGR